LALTIPPPHISRPGIGRYVRELVRALAGLGVAGQPQYRLFVAGRGPTILGRPARRQFRLGGLPLNRRWLERLWYRLRLP